MSLQAWRIDKFKWAADSFSGEGARLCGGRWNSPGHPMVYTSEHPALAAMEILVHAIPEGLLVQAYCLIAARFDESLVDPLPKRSLPKDWASHPVPRSTQRLGDAWLASADSRPVLRVPSVAVAGSFNYLLNPRHPHFRRVRIGKPKPFQFDPRLIGEQER